MKNLFIILITIFFLSYGTSHAQDFNPKKNNYLALSKNIEYLKPVMLTASDLSKEDGKKYGKFFMVIYGKTVEDIPNNDDFINLLKEAESLNIEVFVCELALKKFNVDLDKLPSNLKVTKNAFLYGYQLQKEGFITLTL